MLILFSECNFQNSQVDAGSLVELVVWWCDLVRLSDFSLFFPPISNFRCCHGKTQESKEETSEMKVQSLIFLLKREFIHK